MRNSTTSMGWRSATLSSRLLALGTAWALAALAIASRAAQASAPDPDGPPLSPVSLSAGLDAPWDACGPGCWDGGFSFSFVNDTAATYSVAGIALEARQYELEPRAVFTPWTPMAAGAYRIATSAPGALRPSTQAHGAGHIDGYAHRYWRRGMTGEVVGAGYWQYRLAVTLRGADLPECGRIYHAFLGHGHHCP